MFSKSRFDNTINDFRYERKIRNRTRLTDRRTDGILITLASSNRVRCSLITKLLFQIISNSRVRCICFVMSISQCSHTVQVGETANSFTNAALNYGQQQLTICHFVFLSAD